jgi:hypothetical protein
VRACRRGWAVHRRRDHTGFQGAWPVEDGGNAHTAFVKASLAAPQVAVVCRQGTLFHPAFGPFLSRVGAAGKDGAAGATVVAGEDDQGVFAQASLVEGGEDVK